MPPEPPILRHFRVLTYNKKFLDPPLHQVVYNQAYSGVQTRTKTMQIMPRGKTSTDESKEETLLK